MRLLQMIFKNRTFIVSECSFDSQVNQSIILNERDEYFPITSVSNISVSTQENEKKRKNNIISKMNKGNKKKERKKKKTLKYTIIKMMI